MPLHGGRVYRNYPNSTAAARLIELQSRPMFGNRLNSRSVLYPIFFFSGATGLVYEVIWVRLTGLVFGNTSHAISTVLGAFMAGLATHPSAEPETLVVRTTADEGMFEDETRLNRLLNGVRSDFASLLSGSRPSAPS